jgi:endoglucanase
MSLDLNTLLKQFSETAAPSGHEGAARKAIRAAWAGLANEFYTDGLGSLIAVKHGTGPEPRRKIMLCAHMDEIGLIAAEIRGAFIRTEPLGGIDYRTLLSQPVIVHGRQTLKGVFGAAPPHMALDRKKYPGAADLWVDVGLSAEDVRDLVRVGDLITFDSPYTELKGDRVAGKSFDNRASVAAVTLCLDELAHRAHAWDVIAVAAVQEEVGANGAVAAAYQVQPDLAIAIDGTFATQRGVDEDEGYALGGGPTISRGPNFHPRLVEMFRDLAKELDIKLPVEALPGDSGTDAWLIQVSREGVPVLLLGIPLRNMHSPVEVLDLRDVKRAGRLLAAFVAGLEPDFLGQIVWPELDGDA